MWRVLFPEKDERNRIDETITPYVVRHLTPKIEKSKQKLRNDRLTIEEFENIVTFFDRDPEMQFYLTLAFESLGRPQEILYTRIGDLESIASMQNKSASEALREILQRVMQKERKNLYINPF